MSRAGDANAGTARGPDPLVAAARTAQANAYAPYSGYRVGAALRSASGRIYAGANVENAAYGLSRCAEQSAVQAMVSAGERSFDEIVVYSDGAVAPVPCGGCRQVLFQFAADATVRVVTAAGEQARYTVRELLPDGFGLAPEDAGG